MSDQPSPSKVSREIYFVRCGDGTEYGPCNISQIQELVKHGKIKATTMINSQSAGKWHLAASVVEIRSLLRKLNPTQDSTLNRIRGGKGNVHDSAHAMIAVGRISSVRIKKGNGKERLAFWKRFFHK